VRRKAKISSIRAGSRPRLSFGNAFILSANARQHFSREHVQPAGSSERRFKQKLPV
jgi:hypothetical protein